MKVLTYATVCSGIECMSVACRGLPLKPVFFSEIEPFPCAILKAHYPDVPNLGDMSKIQVTNQTEITNGTINIRLSDRLDILAGGTPCQDVSVAGKRAGMQEGSGTRSSLAFDFVRLARELRPRWVIWENVAGSIDSKNAPDFLRFASALGDCGYSLAWRVLDAQYVRVDGMERAVPQRRRRVWVVGCLGADESVPAQILFEPDCVAGNTPPRRRTGQGFAYSLARCDRVDAPVVGSTPGVDCLNFQGSKGNNCVTSDGSCPNLNAMHGHDVHVVALDGDKLKPRDDQRKGCNGFGVNDDGAGYTLTAVDRHGVAYGINPVMSGVMMETKPAEETAQTLRKSPGGENGVVQSIGFKAGQSKDGGLGDEREVSPTLSHKPSALEPTVCCNGPQSHPTTRGFGVDIAPTMGAAAGDSGNNKPFLAQSQCDLAAMRYIVRRPTPTECERLMGLPDGYTIPTGLRCFFDANGEPSPELVSEFVDIFDKFNAIMADYAHTKPPKGKSYNQVAAWMKKIADPATCPDSPRYKGCGNGWATNQPRWILTRMLSMEGIEW